MVAPRMPEWRGAALPAGIAAVAAVECLSVRPAGVLLAVAVEFGACLLLVLRRRWTVPACTAAGVLALLVPHLGPRLDELTAPLLVLWLAVFSLARHVPDLRGLPAVLLFLVFVLGAQPGTAGRDLRVEDVLWVCTLVLPPYGAGLLGRRTARRAQRLAEDVERLTAAQERVRLDAASAERARIARELHDVLAHSVSAMVLQTAAAEDLVRADPERAAGILREVADTGRRALSETGRLLHLVREPGGVPGLPSDNGLDRLPELLEGFRHSGMHVELSVVGSLAGLPAGVDLSAYRIAQEGLTNALRHGADRRAALHVARGARAVEVRVENRVRDRLPGAGAGHGGLGLVGVAERVSVYGGTLRHGPTADGRYVLSATLPLPGAGP